MRRLRLALVMDLVIRGDADAFESLSATSGCPPETDADADADADPFSGIDMVVDGGRGSEKMGEGGTPGLAQDSIS